MRSRGSNGRGHRPGEQYGAQVNYASRTLEGRLSDAAPVAMQALEDANVAAYRALRESGIDPIAAAAMIAGCMAGGTAAMVAEEVSHG